jgi:hypothetical protein
MLSWLMNPQTLLQLAIIGFCGLSSPFLQAFMGGIITAITAYFFSISGLYVAAGVGLEACIVQIYTTIFPNSGNQLFTFFTCADLVLYDVVVVAAYFYSCFFSLQLLVILITAYFNWVLVCLAIRCSLIVYRLIPVFGAGSK